MSMAFVDEIRAAYLAAIAPLVIAQTESHKRCKDREEITRMIEAYAKLHLAAEDMVRQKYGLPPVKYCRSNETTGERVQSSGPASGTCRAAEPVRSTEA